MGPKFSKVSGEDDDEAEPHLGDLAEEVTMQILPGELLQADTDVGLNVMLVDSVTNLAK
jgi:hypothetical protein